MSSNNQIFELPLHAGSTRIGDIFVPPTIESNFAQIWQQLAQSVNVEILDFKSLNSDSSRLNNLQIALRKSPLSAFCAHIIGFKSVTEPVITPHNGQNKFTDTKIIFPQSLFRPKLGLGWLVNNGRLTDLIDSKKLIMTRSIVEPETSNKSVHFTAAYRERELVVAYTNDIPEDPIYISGGPTLLSREAVELYKSVMSSLSRLITK